MNIKGMLDQLEELWKRRSALKSLIAFLIILNIGCISLGSILNVLLSNIKFFSKPEDYFTFYSYFAVVISLANVFVLTAIESVRYHTGHILSSYFKTPCSMLWVIGGT